MGNGERIDTNGDGKQSPLKNDGLPQSSSEYQHEPLPSFFNSQNDFICITCKRGPPHTKKYAKNQCQTCYKKTKKYTEDSLTLHPSLAQYNSSNFLGSAMMNGGYYGGPSMGHVMFQNNFNDFNFRNAASFYNKSSSSEKIQKQHLNQKSSKFEEEYRNEKN